MAGSPRVCTTSLLRGDELPRLHQHVLDSLPALCHPSQCISFFLCRMETQRGTAARTAVTVTSVADWHSTCAHAEVYICTSCAPVHLSRG